jgi:hypothetical protein
MKHISCVGRERFGHSQYNVLLIAIHKMRALGYKPVVGTLGFRRKHGGIMWIFGHPCRNRAVDYDNHDFHMWFEDSLGRICDVDFEHYATINTSHSLNICCDYDPCSWKLGTTQEWLKRGFHHVKSTPLINQVVQRKWLNDLHNNRIVCDQKDELLRRTFPITRLMQR